MGTMETVARMASGLAESSLRRAVRLAHAGALGTADRLASTEAPLKCLAATRHRLSRTAHEAAARLVDRKAALPSDSLGAGAQRLRVVAAAPDPQTICGALAGVGAVHRQSTRTTTGRRRAARKPVLREPKPSPRAPRSA